jgi:AcrR family transcriptional regulator
MKTKNKLLEEKIFHNALKFLSSQGIKGWNMNDLAAESGITKRTLYKIIESKELLVLDIILKSIDETRKKFLEITRSEPDYIRCLDRIVGSIPELMKNVYITRFNEILREYPDIEPRIVAENEIFFIEFRDFFQSGIDRGILKKSLTPEFILSVFQSLLLFFAKYSTSQEEALEKLSLALHCMVHGGINDEISPV